MDLTMYRGGHPGVDIAAADQAAQLYKGRDRALKDQELAAKDREIISQAAKQAIDPATGQYDLNRHVQLLQEGGFPELAQALQSKSLDNLKTTYAAIDATLGAISEDPKQGEAVYAQQRKTLIGAGMPAGMMPEKYDPNWVRQQHIRLGQALKRFGAYGPIATGPNGAALYGQKDQDTGEVQNVQQMYPHYPPAGAGGRMPAAVVSKQAFADAMGVDLGTYLRWEANAKQAGPDVVYRDAFNRAMQSTFGDQAAAEQIAQQMVESIFGPGTAPVQRSKAPGPAPGPAIQDPLGIRNQPPAAPPGGPRDPFGLPKSRF